MASKNMVAGGLFAAAVLVALTGNGGGASAAAGPSAASAAMPPAAAGSGTLDCRGLEALWEAAGGSPSAAFTAAEVAMAESSGRQDATLVDGDGSVDRGYWQINSSHGSQSTYDAMGNARAAVAISSNGTNWSPWVTYQKGLEAGKC